MPYNDGPAMRRAGEREMRGSGKVVLGLLLLALGFLFLYLLVTLWPAVETANAGKNGSVTWFWRRFAVSADATLLLLVILVSALGSYIHVTVSFSDFAGNRQLVASWMWWYVLRMFVGSSLAVLFYFAIRGGFFSAASDSSELNVYGIAALSGLVGLFSKQATDKLREIFDTAFRTEKGYGDDARGDGVANPSPTLGGSEPAEIAHGELQVTLVGSGFNRDSTVRVTSMSGIEEPRTVEFIGPTALKVTLEAKDIANAGSLTFVVTNPEPGGGSSQPLTIVVSQANGDAVAGAAAAPVAG